MTTPGVADLSLTEEKSGQEYRGGRVGGCRGATGSSVWPWAVGGEALLGTEGADTPPA